MSFIFLSPAGNICGTILCHQKFIIKKTVSPKLLIIFILFMYVYHKFFYMVSVLIDQDSLHLLHFVLIICAGK